jgi:tetratricopeptide (TPR) repeat protein
VDIWKWVVNLAVREREAGRPALSRLVHALPEAVGDDQYERAAALVPEGVALARAMKNPWLEVFFRHWDLQARVVHQGQGATALADAVSLLDFSHQDATRDCPQSVCTVQDICECYQRTDGAGFAAEREAVARETLERINPSWPCFSCVGSELCTAIADGGRISEARATLDALVGRYVAARRPADHFQLTRANLLYREGRWEELLALVDVPLDPDDDTKHRTTSLAIDRAAALAHLGRFEEACKALPPWRSVDGTVSLFAQWIEVVEHLVGMGLPNDAALGVAVRSQVDTLARFGCHRDVITCGAAGVRLALGRGGLPSARALLSLMETAVGALARPLDAPEIVARTRAAVAAAEAALELPDNADAVLARLKELGDRPEEALTIAVVASRRWHDRWDLGLALAGLHLSIREFGQSVEAYRRAIQPGGDVDHALGYGEAALGTGDAATIDAVVADLRGRLNDPSTAAWIAGRAAYNRGDYPACLEILPEVLVGTPDARNTRRLLAAACQNLGDHAGAVRWLNELIALGGDPGRDDWERMLSGTIAGDWASVRDSASRLGFDFPGHGPIDVQWHPCKVRIGDDDLWARRTGPATARILSVRPSDQPQVWGRLVAFRATPLNEVDPEDKEPIWVYPWVHDLEIPDVWTFEIDGVRPDDWDEIEAALDAYGGVCQVRSSDEYRLRDLPAVYATVVVPASVSAEVVHEWLATRCAGFSHPLVWPVAAERAGDAEAVARMREIAAAYGM